MPSKKSVGVKFATKIIITPKMVSLVAIANMLPMRNVQYTKLLTNLSVVNVNFSCFLLQIFKVMIYWT